MEPAGRVAVVIPSWNTLRFLPRCLDSVRAQEVGGEVFVVDNGSSDGSVEYLRDQGVDHIALAENAGFAAAVNLAAASTSATAVFVLNADATLEPGCLARLLEALEADSSLGGVQPRILQGEGGRNDDGVGSARLYSAGQALTADGRAFEIGMGEAQSPELLDGREVFGVCGAACLLRRELFDELGGYDERYFAFYEDVDLNVRARIAGWRFAYVPDAVVWHVGNASWSEGFSRPDADNARLVARNRVATQVKFMPFASVPRIAAVEVGALARAARQRRLLATLRGKLSALSRLPDLIRDRRRLRRTGDVDRARRWLGA
jgi:GT2 family glycosyltransferase